MDVPGKSPVCAMFESKQSRGKNLKYDLYAFCRGESTYESGLSILAPSTVLLIARASSTVLEA